jgi:hypothetical protein
MPAHRILPQLKVGDPFERLTILRLVDHHDGQDFWECQCSCGNKHTTTASNLRNRQTRSCGCLQKECTRNNQRHGESGKNKTREYRAWLRMMSRVYNPTNPSYSYYGGKGIIVCTRWHTYENFLSDTGRATSDDLTLDRFPNKNGNYEPGNVRWATPLEQGRNKNNNRLITYNGITRCLSEWPEHLTHLGLKAHNIACRIDAGWPLSKVFTKPRRGFHVQ